MSFTQFVGRSKEIDRLSSLRSKKTPSLVVVKGRRRVGKSRLISYFSEKQKDARFFSFAGIAPQPGMTAQTQRDHFARQLATYLSLPPFTFHDWSDAFEYLESQLCSGDVILFDEISWMGAGDPAFIPKLKAWWDMQQKPLMLVLCGSVSPWIDENILKSTALFGRINLVMTLEPLPLPDAAKLLRVSGLQCSSYDKYKLLSVLGGIPWYLEQVKPGYTVDALIKQLCFEKDGELIHEFDRIFHDLFNGKGTIYKKILVSLKDGMKTLADIRTAIDFPQSGTLSNLMEHLITAGFVQKQNLWSFKTHTPLKQSLYRICDPYIRFYLKLIEPYRNKIALGGFDDFALSSLPGFDAHIGLQLEQLLLQNRAQLLKGLGVNPAEVVASGPYRQSQTTAKSGCQIDFLVQTQTKNLFVCEFKFKRSEIGIDIVSQVEEKMRALKVPRGFAAIPVLFHIGGVSTNVALSDYFYRIIDITDFLEE